MGDLCEFGFDLFPLDMLLESITSVSICTIRCYCRLPQSMVRLRVQHLIYSLP